MASYEYDNPDDAYREAQRRILSATDELYLLNLGLIDLPPEIFRLTSLKVLDVSDNLLTTLPPNINYLTNLKILRIHNNRLSDIPTELTQLTNLEVLDLGMNQIRELPPGFFKMAKLRTLFCMAIG